ncbi:glycoside hydrolase superfamily [Podospora didyma]|uniref:Endoglucanase EG-II n=1 Tax=Podospora didyma TaxID=330526 RepID=A0AAE0K111_9PEZI|nr:glycoside hydrolase superfamily [Podospora didyma]
MKWLVFFSLSNTVWAGVQFLGVSIAGGDFGCQIDGSCPTGSTQLPLSSFGQGGGDGDGQMKHFVQDDGINMFRLPISWQSLVNNKLGGTLDANNFAKYDKLVQACLATGAHCMVEIHNFARWNGAIIGQSSGTVTDEHFVSLWSQIATKYARNDKIVFELMNEPHDLDVPMWAATCQKVIAAIRGVGATTQIILLPGTNFDSAAMLVSSGSAEALMALTNPDGTTDNLLLDIHKYLDVDNSGTHAECVTNNTAAFGEVAEFLRRIGRKGIVSETGAAPGGSSCLAKFCEQNAFINANSDAFIGLVTWAAGSFGTSYLLSATPSKQGGKFVNNGLMAQCVVGTWKDAPDSVHPIPTSLAITASLSPTTAASNIQSAASNSEKASEIAAPITSTTQTGQSALILPTPTGPTDTPTTLILAPGISSVLTSDSRAASAVPTTTAGSGRATTTPSGAPTATTSITRSASGSWSTNLQSPTGKLWAILGLFLVAAAL